MRIKPTSVYENIQIYYTTLVINLLHIPVTFCGHFQVGYITKTTESMYNYKILSSKYLIQNIR